MPTLNIERVRGGFNPLKARGEVDASTLSAAVVAAIDDRFRAHGRLAPHGNEPVYRLTRRVQGGTESVDVPEHLMPAGLVAVVKDELP
jgi:hypothetical protein